MMQKRILMEIFIGLFVFLFSINIFAEADHFTFKVPVELNKIHNDLKQWRVRVEVWSEPTGNNPGTGHVATGYGEFSVNNGRFRGTIIVKGNCERGGVSKPEHANRYEVILQIKDPKSGKWTHANLLMKQNGLYPYNTKKPFVWGIPNKVLKQ